jgi:hypothetical protein
MFEKFRYIVLNDTPHNIVINDVVAMNEAMTKTYNIVPFDFRMFQLEFIANFSCGLANVLKECR